MTCDPDGVTAESATAVSQPPVISLMLAVPDATAAARWYSLALGATELHHNPDYHTISVVPYGTEVKPVGLGTYVIWKHEPPQG